MAKFTNTFLIWVGSEHYAKMEDWIQEAKEQGVSKRLPNEHMAKSLMEPGTAIFVAHDEGEREDCPECATEIDCPDCRRADERAQRENVLRRHLEGEASKLEKGSKERKSLETRAENAAKRQAAAEDEIEGCDQCLGTGKLRAGSGGKVTFNNGETWDYRRYNYFLHQPKKWTADEEGGIAEEKMCECCGGKGELPKGVVFGLIVPERFEYITDGSAERDAAMAARGFTVVSAGALKEEAPRKCGRRKPGGVYAVTSSARKGPSPALAAAFEAGVSALEVEVHGDFVTFLKPISIPGHKRHRGLARFTLSKAISEEAEMIADADG